MSQNLSKEQLDKLQGLQNEFNAVKFEIADMEIKKSDLINKVGEIKGKFAAEEKELIKEFGQNAIINLQTGEVKQPEETEEK
ncbi:MAG: hypothetical protein HKN40_02185 [Winogradskyella sp.]|uniref:hypothetical protein n=1 Tax=Winogradskyella sp. TaxID=1883156 RepID=UPI0017A6C0E4|nr:hypothetical protein [Winogradskyella sp.]